MRQVSRFVPVMRHTAQLPNAASTAHLMPATRDSDAVCHCVQFFVVVGEHVAHDHPAERGAHVVNVDAHGFTSGAAVKTVPQTLHSHCVSHASHLC